MKRRIYPTILGMKPPTKEVVFMEGENGDYHVLIFHATWEDGVQTGIPTDKQCKRHGLADWLTFCDSDTLRSFGEQCINLANTEVDHAD